MDITAATRRKSYEEIKPQIGERHKQCLTGLRQLGGSATANELAMHLYRQGLTPAFSRNYVHPRLTELVGMGLVSIAGVKERDSITGRTVALYEVKEGGHD